MSDSGLIRGRGQKAGLQDVRGDTKAMPDRGTSTGVKDSYGASLDANAVNRKPMEHQGSTSAKRPQCNEANC